MNAVYVSTKKDITSDPTILLEVEGYGCGIIEMNWKVFPNNFEPFYLCCSIIKDSLIMSENISMEK